MHIVFLRGSIPPDNEHPEKLEYSSIEECEDHWTQLFYEITKKLNAYGTIIYQGGKKRKYINNFFEERWVKSIPNFASKIKPDIIFARGGFPYYDPFIKFHKKAKKIYYGAGARYYPQTKFKNYDLFLVDSPYQKEQIIKKGKNNVYLFIKPAARLFKPKNVKKQYDICFMANATQGDIKRHRLFLKSLSGSNLSILSLGNKDNKYINLAKDLGLNITWGGWSLRKYLPKKISSCRIGVICCTNYDSCPRVIPEYLACNVPIIATDNMNFWHEKYITEETGILVDYKEILSGCNYLLNKDLNPVNYYNNNLNLDCASDYLVGLIEKIL